MTFQKIEGAPQPVGPVGAPEPLLEISYFTDPLCCWSWGFEPQLRRLRSGFAGRIAWRTRMGGMIQGWDHFDDPINSVHRPSQMGPVWIQAGSVTGMPMEAMLWVGDPPSSSIPACVAVTAAGLQSPAAADLYLRRVRESVMVHGRNIAREEVLLDVAMGLAESRPDLLDAERFAIDFAGREARSALEDDIREARYRGIARFPCLVLRRSAAPSISLVGWRPYASLLEAVRELVPELGEERQIGDPEAFRKYWDGATDRELAEIGRSNSAESEPAQGPHSSGSGES